MFITGGSTGIGLEIAKHFAAKGAKVIVSARRSDVLQSAVAEINIFASTTAAPNVTPLPAAYVSMDVSDDSAVAEGIQQASRIFSGQTQSSLSGASSSTTTRRRRNSTLSTPRPAALPDGSEVPIDILICNAGYSYPARFLSTPVVEAKRQMDINYFGCVNVIRAVLPSMFDFHVSHPKAAPSRIVCISSLAAVVPAAGFTSYAPTKAALVAFCHSLDMESSARGVRAQVVFPPDVATPGFDKENEVKSEECKRICSFGGSAPFTASEMGRAVVDSIANGSGFAITLGLDGWLLARLGAMMQPGTFLTQFIEIVGIASVARIVGIVFSAIHYSIVRSVIVRERPRATL